MLKRVGGGRETLLLPTLLTASFAVAARFDIVPWLRGPAPYPPEWQWGFGPEPVSGGWLPAVLAGGIVLALIVLSGSRWAQGRPRLTANLLLGAGAFAGWAFSLALLGTSPEGPFRALLSRAASRTITSYHAVAVSEDARDPRAFLSRHAALLADYRTSAKHAATHPPGPVLFYRAALALAERSAPLTEALLGAAAVPEREFPPPNTRPARAAALLGALVLGVLGTATAWPVASLAETLGLGPLAAARVGVLYLLLPGPALMVPQFDGALALPVAGATALLASAAASGRAVVPKALLAGGLGALALFTSYGAAAFLGIGALPAGAFASTAAAGVRRFVTAAALAAATLLALLGASALLGHDPVASARAALAIHREAYTAPRSYALWLFFNPLDLAVFLGLPIAVLGAARWRTAAAEWRSGVAGGGRFVLALGGALAALVLSGVTRGEVGRIWIPLMPLLLVGALVPGEDAEAAAVDRRGFTAGLAALLVTLCLVIRTSWEL